MADGMKKRYGMVIDLNRCIGCDACTIACRQEKASSKGVLFSRVFKVERGKYPDSRLAFLPVLCMNCAEPPCVEVCTTEAMTERDDGIVVIDAEGCIGCNNCVYACPYGALNSFRVRLSYFEGEKTPYEIEHEKDYVPRTIGKCDFCAERVTEGRDPACVAACSADARIFGDLNDKESKVSTLIVEKAGVQLKPEMGVDPSVYYV